MENNENVNRYNFLFGKKFKIGKCQECKSPHKHPPLILQFSDTLPSLK